ncbi:hypothetical protein [Alkalibacillus aidingensis]|uniref:hypothetical protein n=1 Tax=Alkalibacillus aidingensis TaxID=2747607 RepID=UPI00166041FF|nr:hypothetical protein [Alkalibacillus aidingensis]
MSKMSNKIVYPLVIIGAFLITLAWLTLTGDDEQSEFEDAPRLVFSLDGSSQYWELSNYQIELSPEEQIARGGKLSFKREDEYHETDYFHFQVIADIHDHQEILSSSSIVMNNDLTFDLSDVSLGESRSEGAFLHEGEPVLKEDIERIYAVIEWQDPDGEQLVDEMLLYQSNY